MQEPKRKLKDVERLLSAFPPTSGVDPAQALRNYLDVAEDFDADLVESGVTICIKGQLPGHDGRFAPTAPMFAGACRKAAHNRQHAAYLKSFTAPRLMAPEIEKTDDQRMRVRQMTKEQQETMAAIDLHHTFEDIAAAKGRWEKVNARFYPDMSDEAVKARLMRGTGTHWTAGDEEDFAA